MPCPYELRSYHRHSIRARCYDYSQPGTYFVTICADGMKCLFGGVESGRMHLSSVGQIVQECWQEIPEHFSGVELDAFVVMPNHFHGILLVSCRGAACCAPTKAEVPAIKVEACRAPTKTEACHAPTKAEFGRPVANSLSTIIRSFKSATTRRIRETAGNHGLVVWQRNYFEHIVRNDDAMEKIRQYIVGNPWNWDADAENQRHNGEDKFDAWLRSFRMPPRTGTACRAPTNNTPP